MAARKAKAKPADLVESAADESPRAVSHTQLVCTNCGCCVDEKSCCEQHPTELLQRLWVEGGRPVAGAELVKPTPRPKA